LLPAGAIAGWGLHPLESAAFARRTPTADLRKRAGSGAAIRRCQYQYIREGQAGAMYEFMREFAALEPQPPELQQLFRTVHGNQAAMDGFGEYRSDFCRCSQKAHSVAATAEGIQSVDFGSGVEPKGVYS